jgi:DNA-binding MarR family transcriptional regulator
MRLVADVNWLDEEEGRAWRGYVEASALLGDYLDQQLQADVGMPHAHYAVLVRLAEAPGRSLRMSTLAEQLRITRSRLSHTIAKLETAGAVERRDDPSDRRGQLAVLAEGGARLLEAAAPGHVAAVRQALFDHLTREQVRQLAAIGEAVTAALTCADGSISYPGDLPWRRR